MTDQPQSRDGASAAQRQAVSEWLMALQEMQSKKREINWIALSLQIADAVVAAAPRSERGLLNKEWNAAISAAASKYDQTRSMDSSDVYSAIIALKRPAER